MYVYPMVIRKKFSALLLLVLPATTAFTQQDSLADKKNEDLSRFERKTENAFRIMFYNVENLFDTFDDPNVQDEEFLPSGDKGWNEARYLTKLDNIYKTVTAVGGWDPPAIIGFCEVENRLVLNELINKTPLKKYKYDIVHEDSRYVRGADVALIYRTDKFRPISHEAMQVIFPFEPSTTTRDVLFVTGIVNDADTIHIFVNHWPSRLGGQEASNPKRMYVAELIKAKVDSLYKAEGSPNIIIMGDFNDEPGDPSLTQGLQAKAEIAGTQPGELYNCMYPYFKKGIGTEKYKDHWGLLDQIIISEPLLNRSSGLVAEGQQAYIFDAAFLLTQDQKFLGMMPFRTYSGPRYLGGFSDHLPVFIDLVRKKK